MIRTGSMAHESGEPAGSHDVRRGLRHPQDVAAEPPGHGPSTSSMTDVSNRLERLSHRDLLKTIGTIAARKGVEAYAVGGIVRDVLLDRPTTDVDVVTVGRGSGILLADAVAGQLGGVPVHVYPSFGTAAIRLDGRAGLGPIVVEFVAARRESYRADSRKPEVESGTLEEDLARRDFTVNAMAADLHPDRFGRLVDPFDGCADVTRHVLRTPLAPGETFEDDPLRIIRAARFAAQLDFNVHPDVLAAMRARADRVRILSQERITEEFQKILCTNRPSVGFALLQQTGVLPIVLRPLSDLEGVEAIDGHRHKDNFHHTLQVVDNLVESTHERSCSSTIWLRWAALFHDIAKPATKRFVEGTGWTFHGHEDRGARMIPRLFRALKLPMDERMHYVQRLVRLHHRPVALVDEHVTDSAVRRLLFEAGDDVEDLMVLVRADITSKNPRRVSRYLKAFDRVEEKMAEVEEKDRLRNFQPPVDGNEIMQALDLAPGPLIGVLKDAIREAILEGEIPNDHDAAFEHLMRIKDDVLASHP